MERFDALDVIARTRGKVDMDSAPTGEKLFPLWGWLTAVFYSLAFLLVKFFDQPWGVWMWIGIPVVGIPLMIAIIRKDREESHMRSRRSKLVLNYWIFAACAIACGGFLFGFCGIYEIAENPMICLLVGIGAFVTGESVRFRPMVIGGLAGAGVGICSFVLQGDLWVWQMLAIVLVAIVTLIVPGHMYAKYLKDGV